VHIKLRPPSMSQTRSHSFPSAPNERDKIQRRCAFQSRCPSLLCIARVADGVSFALATCGSCRPELRLRAREETEDKQEKCQKTDIRIAVERTEVGDWGSKGVGWEAGSALYRNLRRGEKEEGPDGREEGLYCLEKYSLLAATEGLMESEFSGVHEAGQTSPCSSVLKKKKKGVSARISPPAGYKPNRRDSQLEGLDKSEGLLDRSSDGEVVDGDLSEGSLGVDEEKTSERNTLVLEEDSVVTSDLVGLVGEEGELEVGSETSLVSGKVGPGD
jgi:hypothetical protein